MLPVLIRPAGYCLYKHDAVMEGWSVERACSDAVVVDKDCDMYKCYGQLFCILLEQQDLACGGEETTSKVLVYKILR